MNTSSAKTPLLCPSVNIEQWQAFLEDSESKDEIFQFTSQEFGEKYSCCIQIYAILKF